MLSIVGYFWLIIVLALRIFAALSDTTAELRSGPTFSIISSIFPAKYSAVWESRDKSDNL